MKKNFKLILYFLIFLFFPYSIFAQKTTDYEKILAKFEEWKHTERQKGNYASENCCMIQELYDCENNSFIAIPKDVQFFFTDLNNDNKLDALVTFNPIQCDGGNALMNAQTSVFIISNGYSYYTDDQYIYKIEKKLNKDQWGFLEINGAKSGSITAIYNIFKPEDFRCCPSIKKKAIINYKTKEVYFLERD